MAIRNVSCKCAECGALVSIWSIWCTDCRGRHRVEMNKRRKAALAANLNCIDCGEQLADPRSLRCKPCSARRNGIAARERRALSIWEDAPPPVGYAISAPGEWE